MTTVQKWGNSLAVRIPRAFAAELGIVEGAAVDLTIADGQIVVRPRKRERVRLTDLLSKITPENIPHAVDWGSDVGAEVW